MLSYLHALCWVESSTDCKSASLTEW
jgi:hypothetical protein